MRTVAEIQKYVQDTSNDSSAKTQTAIQSYINILIKDVKRQLKINYEINTTTLTTIASTGTYELPMNYRQAISCIITVGSVDYPIQPIASRDQWDDLVTGDGSTAASDYPSFFFIRPIGTSSGYKISFYPILSSAGNSIKVKYYSYFRDVSSNDFTDKIAGTVSIVNGAAVVTGVGTAFAATDVGRYIRFDTDGFWYKITSFATATSITIDRNYEGTTISGGNYKLGTVPPIPEDATEIVARFTLQRLWEKREDMSIAGGKASYYEDRAKRALKSLRKDIEEMYDSPYVHTLPRDLLPVNPNNYPTGLS
ncbi:hypothetical protein LCGC14_0568130 [marine sediment metagenome]|uniref:Uncharacterized protein n=1 Tax=marine sediment metagenome TaxID=412755 RepID=A0A0F9U6D2_9ZZZZ|nr:hypothetical protein [bacterium]